MSSINIEIVHVEVGDSPLKIHARGKFRDKDAFDFVPSPDSHLFYVDTPYYDGPLDLLLHLIRKHSLDIFDIPIVLITSKYLEALDEMALKNLDIAGEFLLMAATLLQIKSRYLLPKEEIEQFQDLEDAEKDPRAELILRLLAYKAYKEAAFDLIKRPNLADDLFLRPCSEPDHNEVSELSGVIKLKPLSNTSLIEAWSQVLKGRDSDIAHVISRDSISITARIRELMDFCQLKPQITFLEAARFFPVNDKIDIIVTFLAILEMAKLGWLKISYDGCDTLVISINKSGYMLEEDLLGLEGIKDE